MLFLGIGSTVVMARLLSPRDFGLVAMVNTLLILLRVFRDAGLSVATIQKESITEAQVSNLFWLNVLIGTIVTLIVICLSPTAAHFYSEPEIRNIALSLSLTFLTGSIAAQPRALLQRGMRFIALGVVDVGSMAVGLCIGVISAVCGMGYWSLVALQLSTSVVDLIITLSLARWLPGLPTRGAGTRSLIRFGASLTSANLLQHIANSTDTIFIGKACGPEAAGLYSRALALLLRPVQNLLQPLESVFLPVLSRVQTDQARYTRAFMQAYRSIALLSFPLAALLFALSHLIVLVILGDKWAGAIPIFRWLSLVAMVGPLANSTMWLLITQRRTRDIILTGAAFSALTIVSFIIGVRFGADGVALAYAFMWLAVRLPLQYFCVGRSGPITTKELWKVPLLHLPLWAVVVVASMLTDHLALGLPYTVRLCIATLSGIAVATFVVALVPYLRSEMRFLFTSMSRTAKPQSLVKDALDAPPVLPMDMRAKQHP